MTKTAWEILEELEQGSLTWGAAVGAVWPELVRRGYVEPNFGDITEAGRQALQEHRSKK